MERAQADMKERAEAKLAAEREKYEQKLQRYEERQTNGPCGGHKPKPPENQGPKPTDQTNLTDDDSRLMRKNRRAEFRQAYNAQAAVDADGSQLILGQHVTNCASDSGELEPALQSIDPSVGKPENVLADNGYSNADATTSVTTDSNITTQAGAGSQAASKIITQDLDLRADAQAVPAISATATSDQAYFCSSMSTADGPPIRLPLTWTVRSTSTQTSSL